jgi:hypothetical protein
MQSPLFHQLNARRLLLVGMILSILPLALRGLGASAEHAITHLNVTTVGRIGLTIEPKAELDIAN